MSDARVDSWLWAVRLVKTRSAATTLCKAGHVRINGDRAKPAQHVSPGDEVRFAVEGGSPRVVVVRDAALQKRVGAPIAQAAYEDHSPRPRRPRSGCSSGCATAARDARRSATAATSSGCWVGTRPRPPRPAPLRSRRRPPGRRAWCSDGSA
ncbi:hypothetical protein GCM10025881_02670 [Pseudolysinimonas kribbensis]|uniref:RNA-binding S4 domain-containing protein n=1 Tax=Pseudolysinimonas kribbensis TaxID=433641 RepID=A0ABQ6JYW3_9MICO|nr:hypothetical protein GCM10025881_02670 [Pseudolysinimonas kribbensis]